MHVRIAPRDQEVKSKISYSEMISAMIGNQKSCSFAASLRKEALPLLICIGRRYFFPTWSKLALKRIMTLFRFFFLEFIVEEDIYSILWQVQQCLTKPLFIYDCFPRWRAYHVTSNWYYVGTSGWERVMFSHANIDVAFRTRLLDPLRHSFKFHSNKEMSRGHLEAL